MFKKIELHGFKSFADKLEVDFSSGVTAIVGPNGCGKSNVSDAIRWVLGEQSSKALRGTNMQDVIFKGTESRRQLSYCSVNLHFDNRGKIFPVDFEEVVIGRKLYRSGESEYLLNGSTVRLKDIKMMLHDSGVDPDGMTLIGQGQVAQLIGAKPVDRRAPFEEAAGISKHKDRQRTATLKLERVQAELTRVNDVTSEIQRSIGPLLKQAENAKKYLELFERLKVLEINSYIYKYDSVSVEKEKLSSQLSQISTDLSKRAEEIAEYTSGTARAMETLSRIDVKEHSLRDQVLTLSLGLERHLGESKATANRIEILENARSEAGEELVSLSARLGVEQKLLSDAKTTISILKSEMGAVIDRLETMQIKHKSITADERELKDLVSKRERLIAKRETIEQLIQSGEGYKFVVRKIIENSEKNNTITKNIVGVVAKELTVPKNLEVAIEVALGAAAQNIITRDEQNARAMIEMLQSNKWGRATFLPISAIKPRPITQSDRAYLNAAYIIGVASELVSYRNEISTVVSSLLGRVVVVDELSNGIKLARDSGYAFKIVTLDGDVIEPRGSITGGSKTSLNNNLWHSNNLATVAEQISALDKHIEALSSGGDIESANLELTKLQIKQGTLSAQIIALENSLAEREGSVGSLQRMVGDKKLYIKSLESGNADSSETDEKLVAETRKRIEMAKAELVALEANKEEQRAYIANVEDEKAKSQDAATRLHEQYYKTQAQHERIDTDIEALQASIWEKYSVNYSSAYPMRIENFDVEGAKPEITELRRGITRLGHINLDAIEQSKESGERLESYTTQANDLNIAKTDLEKIITDLDYQMEDKFKTTFNQINENFKVVFKELFGGGKAKLELTDPEDWTNSGIEISAEPNGKKLQNITLLSGGEKAMTAIAILFAILKLKPMPFCLLDEIEAALDEANVVRFASYLKNFSQNTQFIVITHRKPTMELADQLYGVTMESRGISKLVSVNLSEYDVA